MVIRVNQISNSELQNGISSELVKEGFRVTANKNGTLFVENAGVGTGDSSVSFTVEHLTFNDVKIVRLVSDILIEPTTFERAQMAAIQGNSLTALSKFLIVEDLQSNNNLRFKLQAHYHFYADYLASHEFIRMTKLFIAELDEIDNGLVQVMHVEQSSKIILPEDFS